MVIHTNVYTSVFIEIMHKTLYIIYQVFLYRENWPFFIEYIKKLVESYTLDHWFVSKIL